MSHHGLCGRERKRERVCVCGCWHWSVCLSRPLDLSLDLSTSRPLFARVCEPMERESSMQRSDDALRLSSLMSGMSIQLVRGEVLSNGSFSKSSGSSAHSSNRQQQKAAIDQRSDRVSHHKRKQAHTHPITHTRARAHIMSVIHSLSSLWANESVCASGENWANDKAAPHKQAYGTKVRQRKAQ